MKLEITIPVELLAPLYVPTEVDRIRSEIRTRAIACFEEVTEARIAMRDLGYSRREIEEEVERIRNAWDGGHR